MKNRTRILIADDNADVRADLRTLLSLLEEIDIVGETASGNDAILLVDSFQPDIIVMDLEMSMSHSKNESAGYDELDGIRAIKKIKANHPHTLIIVLTVHDYQQAVNEANKAGADAFLVKGRDTEKLLEVIKKYETK
jgi:two-component system, NarL family, response regulator DegU